MLTLICVFSNYNKSFYVTIKSSVCENRRFYGMASESFHFLFMNYAVEFVLRLFICDINDYLIEYDKLYILKILTPYRAKYTRKGTHH